MCMALKSEKGPKQQKPTANESEFHAIGQNDFPVGRHQSDRKIFRFAYLFMRPWRMRNISTFYYKLIEFTELQS